jgi:hypothetical protein
MFVFVHCASKAAGSITTVEYKINQVYGISVSIMKTSHLKMGVKPTSETPCCRDYISDVQHNRGVGLMNQPLTTPLESDVVDLGQVNVLFLYDRPLFRYLMVSQCRILFNELSNHFAILSLVLRL